MGLPASAPVLEGVAQALDLDEDQHRYLFGLAGKETARPRRRAAQKAQPQLRRVLDDLTAAPAVVAVVMGRRMDVLAWYPLATATVTDSEAVPERHRNYVRIPTSVFFSPTRSCALPAPTGEAWPARRSHSSAWKRRNTPTTRG
ncbi:hypothetical protein [Streptomyces sp. MMCC 100]|uniref:MmyB family transcriptional regulator n=1 Tax=Streptomyces sp. MMCC 100 TaxID=3163555 RepID=UPI0035A3A9B3